MYFSLWSLMLSSTTQVAVFFSGIAQNSDFITVCRSSFENDIMLLQEMFLNIYKRRVGKNMKHNTKSYSVQPNPSTLKYTCCEMRPSFKKVMISCYMFCLIHVDIFFEASSTFSIIHFTATINLPTFSCKSIVYDISLRCPKTVPKSYCHFSGGRGQLRISLLPLVSCCLFLDRDTSITIHFECNKITMVMWSFAMQICVKT